MPLVPHALQVERGGTVEAQPSDPAAVEAQQSDRDGYRHTQIGYATLIGLVAGSITQGGRLIRDLRAGRRRAWIYLPASILSLATMAIFSSMTVEVGEGEIRVSFTGGLFRRRFGLLTVAETRVVTTPWYTGWGIRITPTGWLYNVWGRGAVELRLLDGRAFTIGSDEADSLRAAIEAARPRLVAA